MEAGFLLGNKSTKKTGLAAKVKDIEGKMLGKDGKPLKSCLKTGRSKTIQANPVGKGCSQSGVSVTKDTPVSNTKEPTHTIHVTETDVTVDENVTRKRNPNLLGSGLDGAKLQGVAVHPKKVNVLVLINDEKVLGANVAIPIVVVDEISDKFANTLYGYFIGERLAFPIVEAYVKNAWAKYGFERAIFRNGFFFFKFSSHEGMVKTLDAGPWFIRSMPIFLYEWSANTKLKKEEIKTVPVWVKFHNVPMVAFSKTGLSLITTQLGRPIMLDACTSDMCLNPWGRNSYARVLVELSSECDVLESIVVAIPLHKDIADKVPKGEGHYLVTLDVEYEWWPPRCSKCKLFDHEDYDCPSKVKHVSSSGFNGVRTDGKHKKKGSNKATSKQGFRFSKPSNLVYRPVSKPVTSKVNNAISNSTTSSSTEGVKGAANDSQVPPKVTMNDSLDSINENGFFKDDINLDQLGSTMDKLMEENQVLELNTNKDTLVSTNIKSAPVEVQGKNKGSILENFLESREASKSKHDATSDSDDSEIEEVSMPFGIPGGGSLDDLEEDLDCYDGYGAQFYDLTEQEKAISHQ
ncbi:zinc knuckle CX2CX4HX4C containing protein [Tanacetum coccineum]